MARLIARSFGLRAHQCYATSFALIHDQNVMTRRLVARSEIGAHGALHTVMHKLSRNCYPRLGTRAQVALNCVGWTSPIIVYNPLITSEGNQTTRTSHRMRGRQSMSRGHQPPFTHVDMRGSVVHATFDCQGARGPAR